MTLRFRKIFFIFLGSLWLLSSLNIESYADVAVGEMPTGLVELKEFRYLVYIFVPPGYKDVKDLAMISVFPSESSLEASAKTWMDIARKRNMIVLVSEAKLREEDVPYQFDAWFLKVQKAIALRYGVTRVFLVGEGASAHYAAYLGLKHPKRFASVSTLGGSWVGPFSKIVKISDRPRKQVPFFVALNENDKSASAAQAKAQKLTAKGYPVKLVMLDRRNEEKTASFREMMLDWGEENAIAHSQLVAKSKNTLKEKVSTAVEEFLAV